MKNSKNKKKKSVSKIGEDDPLDVDLSELLRSGNWQWVRFELRPKNKTITLRVSEQLLEAVKKEAEKSGVDYQKFIRLTLEKLLLKAS